MTTRDTPEITLAAAWEAHALRAEAEIARLRAANRAADEILVKHVIRVARYYWATGSHIETFANEARAALAPAPSEP